MDFEPIAALAHGRLESREVVAGPLDDLGELDLLARELVDQLRDIGAERFQGLGDALARPEKRAALAAELLDKAADLALVVLVGALERGHLVVDERLELAGAAERARDGLVHEGDLAAYGLAERGDGLLRHAVGLGEAHGDLGHGGGAQSKLLRAPGEKREEPQDCHRDDDGGGGEQDRRMAEKLA